MDELDLLKKDWKKNEPQFPKISEQEIYGMLHKKSSSIVKWIFIISIIEFIALNSLSFLLPNDFDPKLGWVGTFVHYSDYVSYAVAAFFIYLFYRNFQSISSTSTTKKLMESILKTRKTVTYYIFFNIAYVFLAGLLIIGSQVKMLLIDTHQEMKIVVGASILLLVSLLLILLIVWLFYRLIYGFLLRRLHKNYEELQKIDL
ncbi:hypothetical protein FLJC2902T_14800 [Flavobacterium limnosediminis JC2902]|uniref:Uncharacterized protein n=1 Tax=Flavobacterium limnosediminis JC2902 TaxID=1341181 RepID=V6SQB9_9FLAO|nr:hypothetical protein [Flavobacterium limnosediminis]ESU28883.1 hypothetical protein FLJC2902T_14800 [Flavobacterium limnosediminis JC2902]